MIDRKFEGDGWDLADAIKNGEGDTLKERFQIYWKNRCDNSDFRSEEQVFEILTRFAINNFERVDWFTLFIEIARTPATLVVG